MMPRFMPFGVLVLGAALLAGASMDVCAASKSAAVPTTTRKVVYEKADSGYRLKVVEAPVPTPGAHQVLVHMHAVSLNRGEIENLAQGGGRDRSGMIAASDGAGEVVALGPEAREFKLGQRVTSMYFNNWNDGPPTGEHVRGPSALPWMVSSATTWCSTNPPWLPFPRDGATSMPQRCRPPDLPPTAP